MATGDKLVNLDSLKTAYDTSAKFTAPMEASSTASAAHAAGEHFIYNGILYIATADIASGATITPVTNCRAVTGGIGGEVSDLKSAFISSLVSETMSGWEKGTFNTTNGSNYTSDSRIRNQTKVGYSTGVCRFKLNSGYSTLMYAWDLSGNYVGAYKTDGTWTAVASGWKSVTEFDLSTVPNYVIKFSVSRVPSSSDITASEGDQVILYKYTDKTLSIENKAADAKMVGDKISDLKSALNFDEYLINAGQYTIKASDLESGAWAYSSKTENDARARIKSLIPVRAGMIISYANTTFDIAYGVMETPTSNTYIANNSGWKTDASGIINITADGYMTFMIRNHADNTATVDPADYNSVVSINTAIENAIYEGRDASANTPKVLAFFSTASLESFGLADMPNMSYTYTTTISKFTDLPEDYPSTTGYGIHIEKFNLNGNGRVSMAVVIHPRNPDVKWVARMVSGETLTWMKCVTRDEFDALKAQADGIEETYVKDQHISRINLWPYVDMNTYKIDDGAVVMSDTKIRGSRYIKCPKWLVTRFGAMDKTGNVNLFAQNSTPESSATINGVTFALNADKNEYTINGINTGNMRTPSYINIMSSAQSTEYLEAGKTYYVKVSGDCDAILRVYYKIDGSIDYDHPDDFNGNGILKLKSDFSGCIIRVYTNLNTQYTDAKFHFELLTPATYTENNDPRIYMYFYNLVNGAYVRNDNILYHVTSTDYLNKFSPAVLGNRVLEIPDGTYMQISDPTGQDFEVYGWDGEHIGSEICGNAYNATVYNKNETTVLLPGNATMVFAKSFATKAVYGEPEGIPGALDLVYSNAGNQGRMCVTLPSGYNFFVVRCQKIVPLTANTTYVTMRNAVYNGNLNDEISCICGDIDYCAVPSLRATKAIKAAEAITGGIKWTALKQMTGYSNEYAYYKDVLYTGAPYVSVWRGPNELGYHISKQTFINAANDLDSAFYKESSYNHQSPGYGLVCTTFAELCNGWPYPIVTNALGYHPDVVVQYTDDLIPGMMLWNDAGHVVLPEMVLKAGNTQEYIVYEGVNPSTTRIARLDTRHDPNFYTSGNGTFHSYEYLHKYIYACTHKSAKGYPYGMYNIYAGMLINGSARPYRGDRSVMTNLSGVKINIKDANATKLYLQKCTRVTRMTITEPTDYLGDRFIKTDDAPIEIDITGTQMTIDSSLLTDGAFYGCYTDTDSIMEYFEYHAVTAGTYSKTGSNFVFDVDRPFWYAIFDRATEQISGVEMWVSIPYVSSGDYSKYRQAFNPAENVAAVAFVKGTLGAYVIPLTQV